MLYEHSQSLSCGTSALGRHVTMGRLLALVILMLGIANPAYAKWPTTSWTLLEEPEEGLKQLFFDTAKQPEGERRLFAQKYKEHLEQASIWFQSMLFKAPRQLNDASRLEFKANERYLAYLKKDTSDIGSFQTDTGVMHMSTHPGFLKPKDSLDELFTASAVHELFHGIQKSNPAYLKYILSKPRGPEECDKGSEDAYPRADQWLTEGTASAVQIQHLERQHGYVYEHAFKGSPRATWVRYFDQPLDWGNLPPGSQSRDSRADGQSWKCGYGTWYFWYAVGNMLGSKDPHDGRRTAYLRYIFAQTGPWEKTALAMADEGLKQAALELNSLESYHGGFFSLYPQFVAQYLDRDSFYEKVENVVLATPSMYETTSSTADNPIEPMATRAWRVRIQLPRNETPMPYIVRFVLDSPEQSSLDGLHLIVDGKVIDRPINSSVLYSHTLRTDEGLLNAEGEQEYFVRVANVARHAAATRPANFTLRIEAEGFYGEKTSGPSNDAITGELAPGFEITGPGKHWTCSGGENARASFAIVTPDGHADQLERMLPQALKNIENDLNRVEREAQDTESAAELKRTQQKRKDFESELKSLLQDSGVSGNIARAANQIRRENETKILAKLYGTNAQGECSVLFSATLPGRQPATQKIAGPHFSLTVTPESTNDKLSELRGAVAVVDYSNIDSDNISQADIQRLAQQVQSLTAGPLGDFDEPDSDWISCSSNHDGCDAGELTLEHAAHNHVSGTFQFRVSRRNPGNERLEYADVAGFINVTSAQTQSDNSLLDFMSRGQGQVGDPFYLPGIEKLLQGGSLFTD